MHRPKGSLVLDRLPPVGSVPLKPNLDGGDLLGDRVDAGVDPSLVRVEVVGALHVGGAVAQEEAEQGAVSGLLGAGEESS